MWEARKVRRRNNNFFQCEGDDQSREKGRKGEKGNKRSKLH